MTLDWVHDLTNVLLIRDPAEVVESYLKSRASVVPEDIGLLQQAALYDELLHAGSGEAPLVIDADDFLRDPQSHLRALCAHLGVNFDARMLSWPPGPRESDGVWAPAWYDAVWRSTGFEPWRQREPRLGLQARAVADACRPAYERLRAVRLTTGLGPE